MYAIDDRRWRHQCGNAVFEADRMLVREVERARRQFAGTGTGQGSGSVCGRPTAAGVCLRRDGWRRGRMSRGNAR